MSHHTDRIQEQLAEARARTQRDIDDLNTRANERTFLDEGIDLLRGTEVADMAGDMGRSLVRQVRDNPLPSALIGAGLLMMATGTTRFSRSRRHDHDVYADRYEERAGLTEASEYEELEALYGDEWVEAHRTAMAADEVAARHPREREEDAIAYQTRLYDAYGRELAILREDHDSDEGFRKRIDNAIHAARDRVDEFRARLATHGHRTGRQARRGYDRTAMKARDAGWKVRNASSNAAHRSSAAFRQGSHSVKHGAENAGDFIIENPFAAAGVAMLAGLAAGSFFGITSREERALSGVATAIDEQAQRLNAKANERVRAYAERVEEVADDLRDQVNAEKQQETTY